eukprot:4775019-Prymnesium_polylepis.2
MPRGGDGERWLGAVWVYWKNAAKSAALQGGRTDRGGISARDGMGPVVKGSKLERRSGRSGAREG